MPPPVFAAAGLSRMVSGIDDRLHRLRTQPGQTLRGRVNHRTREPLLLKYSQKPPPTDSRIVPGGQYHCDHYEAVELSILRHKERCASIGARLFMKPG